MNKSDMQWKILFDEIIELSKQKLCKCNGLSHLCIYSKNRYELAELIDLLGLSTQRYETRHERLIIYLNIFPTLTIREKFFDFKIQIREMEEEEYNNHYTDGIQG